MLFILVILNIAYMSPYLEEFNIVNQIVDTYFLGNSFNYEYYKLYIIMSKLIITIEDNSTFVAT